MITGYDYAKASADLEHDLGVEIAGLTKLVLLTAKSGIRYYPEVRDYMHMQMTVLAHEMVEGEITAEHWQAWLEQFGKGSKMANSIDNPGLVSYINSDQWNPLRSQGSKNVVGRGEGNYRSIDGTTHYSGGGYAGVDLEELAARGDIDKSYGPTPPSYFLRIALQANRNRILEGISRVLTTFPYHKYFKEVKDS
ncbi:hypothetical protein BVG16_13500 [Paenibacillus selenitireducens]|uniref:Uncharacterized protein n=1 Tax=Paenibacillus selenitireducens TaxID=1324314 RepID=A0A1T2XCB4_9BACL|nr:hypothetical protein [Paenibacillus selenitireducens]OPA77465.1 hypothetical protein BVG16_13500 [Paenibacillus selenitireducens]